MPLKKSKRYGAKDKKYSQIEKLPSQIYCAYWINTRFPRQDDFSVRLYHKKKAKIPNVKYTFFKNMPFPLIIATLPLHIIYNLLTFSQAFYLKRIKVFLKAKKDFIKDFKEIYRLRKEIQEKRKISLKELFFSFSKHYLCRKVFLNLKKF